MHVRKDQVVLGSRRGGSCARPKLLRTTILGICADMHKASPYSIPSILGDMNTPKNNELIIWKLYVKKRLLGVLRVRCHPYRLEKFGEVEDNDYLRSVNHKQIDR